MNRLATVLLILVMLISGCGSGGETLEVHLQRIPETVSVTMPATQATEPVTETTAEAATEPTSEPISKPTTEPTTEPVTEATTEPAADSIIQPETESLPGRDYVLNKNTKKFHYPHCGSVSRMKTKNRRDHFGTREEIIGMGYVPCKNCEP